MDKERYVQEIEAHSSMMYRVALTILKNDDDVKDALQEAALKAWAKRDTLREETKFATWMTRILINECYTIRRKSRRLVLMEEMPPQPCHDGDITLRLLLETLPESLRLPLVLHCSEGMDEAEIAAALHLTKPTVRGRIHRARKMLRRELEDHAQA